MEKTRYASSEPPPVHWWLAAPACALLLALVPLPSWLIDDYYSRGLYPWIEGALTRATNLVPFAVVDVVLVVLIVMLGYRFVRLAAGVGRHGLIDSIWEAVRRAVRASGFAIVVFLLVWGLNYRRVPVREAIGNDVVPPTSAALADAVADAGALAARVRRLVEPEGRFHSIALDLRGPMNTALASLGRAPLPTPGEPKFSLLLTPFFVRSGVTGVTNPIGLEIVVSPELLPVERPFVIAHEWAHLAGEADEADASAVGWLACMKGSPGAAYSASLFLVMEAARALPGPVRRTLIDRLDDGVRADLDAVTERLRRQSPVIERATARVYGEYLRANRVADGYRSYSRALTLILSPRFRDAMASYRVER